MTDLAVSLFRFDNTFARDLAGMYEPWDPAVAPEPRLLVLNDDLATELGADPQLLATPIGVGAFAGATEVIGATPIAQAYSGHQFGGFSPRLGDGRALLFGEAIDVWGRRRDVHLKGSGRTPYARGGDGKAAVGPMLREYVIGEALHALGIPTTRALAVIATGERIVRETPLPGALLVRVAASHLRVGSFQYAAAHHGPAMVKRVADYAIARHYPEVADDSNPYLALLRGVVRRQAELVAQWMSVGFIHGVMNTDNTTISGESIDFGPCAFMDSYDPATVFSSIDHGGRYAYANQPDILQWNLARLAETLLPLIDSHTDRSVALATEAVVGFEPIYDEAWLRLMLRKIGLVDAAREGDRDLVGDLLDIMHTQKVDFTNFFRILSTASGEAGNAVARARFSSPAVFDTWTERWADRRQDDRRPQQEVNTAMQAINPAFIARNHLVEEALAAASETGDLDPVHQLVDVLRQPFADRPGLERFTAPAPASFKNYRTFCGT